MYVDQKNIPNLLLCGGPGIGKTTVARALCEEVGCDYIVINGSDEGRLIDTFRTKIKSYASTMSFSGGRKVVIVDEADYLNAESVQPAMRSFIEEFSINCSFIFTCNYKNKIIEPLHSRFAIIDFTMKADEKKKMAGSFFKRIIKILETENVEFDNSVVAEVIKEYFPDFRRIINELQRYSKFGKIDTGILAQISQSSISEITKYLKDKNFGEIRKWVAINNIDPASLYRQIYDSLYDILQPACIPQAVIILADYQYKQAFVADPEINTVACLTELMVSLEFK